MKAIVKRRSSVLYVFLLLLMIGGCASLIAKYDNVAYQKATSLKVDSLAIMDKATDPYLEYEEAVEELKVNIDKAYEYAKGRPKNELITKQWSIMRDPDRNLLGGFLKRWKDKGTLSGVFVTEAKKNVSLGFDQIIGLESGLIKPQDSK
jgi:hypothetical protein